MEKRTSEEFDERQQTLAAEAGAAYQRSLWHMIDSVAHTGAMTTKGEYIVEFPQEAAERLYHLTDDGEFEWVEPSDEANGDRYGMPMTGLFEGVGLKTGQS